jgi:citrate lyase subunit beta / citryl-CoA lyase
MRARRSCLSVPARPARRLEKGAELVPDEVIIDLEDSVPPELKDEAREAVAAALAGGTWAAATVTVRINGVTTPWCENDLRAVAGAGGRLDCVVVPKAEGAADLERVADLLAEAEREAGRERPIGIQALIESALGLRDVDRIAAASPRLEALILGPADLSVSLGFPSPEAGERWDFVRGALLVAARAAGIQAIDGPHLQVSDQAGLVASASRAREFGFDGKWALHPDQIEPLNEVFAPTAAELERAGAILAALEEAPDRGAVMLDGEMIDEASRKRAEQTLARARGAEPEPAA